MLSILIAISVSVGLLIWMWKMKEYDPFPKYTFLKLLIFGAIAVTLSGIVTLIGMIANFIIQIGPDQLKLMTTTEGAKQVIEQINNAGKVITPDKALLGFVRSFVLIGLVEEIFKFIGAKIVMSKEGVVNTWKDALICFAVVALSFQLVEDIQYSAGNIVLAVFRALTPFHFTFAVIMGYIYGLGKVKGNWLYTIASIVVPALIHTLYDFSINLLRKNDYFIFFNLGMTALLFILTIFMIMKLRKWNREGTLDVYI